MNSQNEGMSSVVKKLSYPDIEIQILINDRLHVEAYGWYCCYDFTDLDPSTLIKPAFLSVCLSYTFSL